MALLSPHRFTVEDFHRMADTGVLAPDARVELLEGEIIDMEPIGPFHGGATKRLNGLFATVSRGRWLVSVQDPLRLDRYSEPQPDIMLLRPDPDDYMGRHPTPADVFLLVEVAESSLDHDRAKKLPAYGKAGVPEVWIVDLQEKVVEIHRGPHFLGYEKRTLLRVGDAASPEAFPDVSIDITALLRRAR